MIYSVFLIGNWPGLGKNVAQSIEMRRDEFRNSPEVQWESRINLFENSSPLSYRDDVTGDLYVSIELAEIHFAQDSILFIFTAPGHIIPDIALNNRWRVCAVVGDVHHVSSPLSFLYKSLAAIRPSSVLFVSSILGGDVVCRLLALPYSLYPYLVKRDYRKVDEKPIKNLKGLVISGEEHSIFHPRRRLFFSRLRTILNNSYIPIIKEPFKPFSQWANEISEAYIQVHCSLNGNISHHPILAMTRGCVSILDTDLIKNPYFESFFRNGFNCLTVESFYELTNQCSDLNDLNHLFRNLRSHARESIEPIVGFSNGIDHSASLSYPSTIVSEIISEQSQVVDERLTLIRSRTSLNDDDLVKMMECLQELCRISSGIIEVLCPEPDPARTVLLLIARIRRFRVKIRERPSNFSDVVILSKNHGPGFRIPEDLYIPLEDKLDESYLTTFAQNNGAIDGIKFWPQLVPDNLKIYILKKRINKVVAIDSCIKFNSLERL